MYAYQMYVYDLFVFILYKSYNKNVTIIDSHCCM